MLFKYILEYYLNATMAQMNGKEFRYIRLSDLLGADLKLDAD